MTRMRAQVVLQGDSMLAEDQYVNTWHFDSFDGGTGIDPDSAAVWGALGAFYQAIDGWFSAGLQPTATVKFYDMDDPEPRAPFREESIALTLSASNGLPAEVAICMSYQGSKISGQSQARRRGRVYLGPLASNVLGANINGEQRPDPAFTTAVANAGAALLASAAGPWWMVYSPTSAADPDLASGWTQVDNGWVDNAWDIQRRRGSKATTRTVF